MGIGQLLMTRTDESCGESIASLTKSLEQSYKQCMLCDRLRHPGSPICKQCHVFSVYAQDYYDTFRCKLDLSNGKSQGATCHGHNNSNKLDQSHQPNWTFPTELTQNLRRKFENGQNQYDPRAGGEEEENNEQARIYMSLMPPEIICMILKHLDEISLLNASKVCYKWNQLVMTLYSDKKWEASVLNRWPLFRQSSVEPGVSWLSVYLSMCESAPCVTCLLNSTGDSKLPEPNFTDDERDGSCSRMKRLDQEFISITTVQIEGVQVVPLDSKKYNWMARLVGPHDSPYEGGIFYINFKFPINYPFQPPKVRFLTRIFHPDISRHGDIIVLDLVDPRFWSPGNTLRSLLLSIQRLLMEPHLRSNVEPIIKKIYIKNRPLFHSMAKEWTKEYAMSFESP